MAGTILTLLLVVIPNLQPSNIPLVEIMEEARSGTVLIDNLEHRFPSIVYKDSGSPYIAIGNPSSPGISDLEIRKHQFDNTFQLVVKEGHTGPDREKLCRTTDAQTSLQVPQCDLTLIILHGKRQEPSYGKIILRILDKNDNSPQFAKGNQFELRIPETMGVSEPLSNSPNSYMHQQIHYSNLKTNSRSAISLELPVAHDNDLPENGVKSYRLTTVSGHDIDKNLFTLIVDTENSGEELGGRSRSLLTTPTLRIIGPLDREKQSEYWFHLLALDGGSPQRTGTMTIHLVVTDLNDNCPKFRKPIYHFPTFQPTSDVYSQNGMQDILRISETQQIGSQLLTLIADDSDQDLNGQVTYRLKEPMTNDPNAAALHWFELENSNGSAVLKIARKLDADDHHSTTWMDFSREHSGRLVKLVVEAVDAGSPSLTGSVELNILIENVNDNEPVISVQYTQPYQTRDKYNQVSLKPDVYGGLEENMNGPVTVAHLTVEDGDLYQNGMGIVSAVKEVQCETNDTRFYLEKISNMDYSDGSDSFTAARNRLSPSLQFYKMSSLKAIDREVDSWVYVKVICVDQAGSSYGHPVYSDYGSNGNHPIRLTGSTTVILKIMDVNDNAPKFTQQVCRFNVFETPTSMSGIFEDYSVTEIGQVKALDEDEGKNGEVRYSLLTNPNDIFKLDEKSGVISRVGSIDREKVASLEFLVEARDQGEPAMSSTCTVKVDVIDVNDNPPYWVISSNYEKEGAFRRGSVEDGVYYFSVNEDAPIGSAIGEILAVDADGLTEGELLQRMMNKENSVNSASEQLLVRIRDEVSKITYQLEHDGDARVFSINPRSGELRLAQPLDREARAHYEFRAFALDGFKTNVDLGQTSKYPVGKWKQQQYTATATIIVTVLDVNDNAPQFETPLNGQEFHIEPGSSTATAGTTLFTAKAHDPDIGDNSLVRYSIENGGYGLVEIDSTTGVCYLRETIQQSVLSKLWMGNQISISGRTTNDLNPSIGDRNSAKHDHELTSFSLSLTIIAHDLGQPRRMNSSRMVKLVWTSEAQLKNLKSSGLTDKSLLGSSSASIFLSDTNFTAEKLFIPLVVGAFLLLFLVCVILIGILRCRRLSKDDHHHHPNQVYPLKSKQNKWTRSEESCCTCMDFYKKSTKQERIEQLKQSIRKLDSEEEKFVVNTYGEFETGTGGRNQIDGKSSRPTHADISMKTCLPDFIPSLSHDNMNFTKMRSNDKAHIKWNEIQPYTQDFVQRSRTMASGLSRALSDESINTIRQNDVGYTALSGFPNDPHNSSGLIPVTVQQTGIDSYYNDRRLANQFPFSPFTHRRLPLGTNSKEGLPYGSKPSKQLTQQQQQQQQPPQSQPQSQLQHHQSQYGLNYSRAAPFYNLLGTNVTSSVQVTPTPTYPSFQTMTYDMGNSRTHVHDKYDDLEIEKEMAIISKAGQQNAASTANNQSGWKSKLADAYAENSFV